VTRREIHIAGGAKWIDLLGPTPEELEKLSSEFQLKAHLVQDCLDPKHLPKVEEFENGQFVIFRCSDEHSSNRAATARELTRKLAIFVQENLLITVHRASLPFVDRVFERTSIHPAVSLPSLFLALGKQAVLSFESPLEEAEKRLEKLEQSKSLRELHLLRRRLSVFKRLLWHTSTVLQRVSLRTSGSPTELQDLHETVDGMMFFSDELLEDATHVMHLEISLASQRTNEIVRILTIFSVFFMPLTFIVGVYGMNFQWMPELSWKWGYAFTWFLMLGVTGVVALWFRRKRWL